MPRQRFGVSTERFLELLGLVLAVDDQFEW